MDLRKCHAKRWIFELLREVVVKQSVFQLVDGPPGLGGQMFQAYPDEESAADAVALDAGLAALAGFQSGGPVGFAVRLLDLPTEGGSGFGGCRSAISRRRRWL